MNRILVRWFGAAVALFWLAAGAFAGGYPSRPIHIVIPFAAGGTADPLARMLADVIGRKTGANFVIESRPGGGGNVGNQAVAAADKDGYMVLLGANNNFVVNQFLFPQGAVEPLEVFSFISVLVDQPEVVYVRSDFPASTLGQIIDYVKARPGQINFASPGIGSAPHLAGEMLADQFGLKMVHVPYKGGAPAAAALMTGDVQLYIASLSVGRALVDGGRLKALAVTSPSRLPAMPNLPTTAEAGAADYRVNNWWGLAAPKGTSSEALEWLQREFTQALHDPEVVKRLTNLGFIIVGNTPDQFVARVKLESAQYRHLIESRHIAAQ